MGFTFLVLFRSALTALENGLFDKAVSDIEEVREGGETDALEQRKSKSSTGQVVFVLPSKELLFHVDLLITVTMLYSPAQRVLMTGLPRDRMIWLPVHPPPPPRQ